MSSTVNELGAWYVCEVCGSQMLVSRGGAGSLGCCDRPMGRRNAATLLSENGRRVDDPVGRRYRCGRCGTEVLCTTAGGGELRCCGARMPHKPIRQLPTMV